VTTGSRTRAKGVSFIDYSPKPLYTYMPQMKVLFTTTGPAGSGRQYVARLLTGKDERDTDCKREHSAEGIEGGVRKTQRVSLGSQKLRNALRFCAGTAQVIVRAQNVGGSEGSVMRRLALRVLPAHPRGAFSPQDRAIQMAAEWYRWHGKDPPRGLSCTYEGTEGSGYQWFSCGADRIAVACSGKTTRMPLTGKSNREYVNWGDCGID
jgi:hypothetical protein